jgi:hypothetical protein
MNFEETEYSFSNNLYQMFILAARLISYCLFWMETVIDYKGVPRIVRVMDSSKT